MRTDEILTAVAGTLAGAAFLVDYLYGLIRRNLAPYWLVTISAGGILALVVILLLSVLLDWPAWVIRDAMGVLATAVFPLAQFRMRRLRRAEDSKRHRKP